MTPVSGEESPYRRLRKNQRLLVEELVRRGVSVTVLVKEMELVEARYGAHSELLLDRDSSISPYSTSVICSEKYLTKQLLQRAGLSVPDGEQFFADQIDDALRYASRAKKPLVIKPSNGSHGAGCYTDLERPEEIEQAIGEVVNLIGPKQPFLIEEQTAGMEFRVFVTDNGDYAILHRDPASVTGDGIHTIRELAELETHRRMNPHLTCLCPIILDQVVEGFLKRSGLTLENVPRAGSKIYLRRNSNIAMGGDCEDYTDRAHPSCVELALKALRSVPGLRYTGVDILSIDIEKEQTPERYAILEMNSNPGLNMHVNPGRGVSRNVPAFLADLIFPETKSNPRGR